MNRFSASVRVDPHELAGFRQGFKVWLGQAALHYMVQRDLVWAVHEAAAYAIRESRESEFITVQAALVGEEITVEVTSDMRRPEADHGEDGLLLLSVLVDEIRLRPAATGRGTVLMLRHSLLAPASEPDVRVD